MSRHVVLPRYGRQALALLYHHFTICVAAGALAGSWFNML